MNARLKNRAVALLAGTAVLCLGGAIAAYNAPAQAANAAGSIQAFVNVGATSEATATDALLGLTPAGATATTPGTVTEGGTLFSSYATGATYTLTATGEATVAVALKVEAGKSLKIGGEDVSLEGKSGNAVVTKDVSAGSVEVQYSGALCGVLVTDKGAKTLMAVDYAPGQVVSYGELLAPQLDNAAGFYSDGTSEELPIAYDAMNAGTGLNVNFTTIDVTGTVAAAEGVELPVKRTVTTMPDDLVYFINCGSYTTADSVFPEPETIDSSYSLNQIVFDHYGQSLINYGTPDRTTTKGGDWGVYTVHAHNAPGDATFPYNSFVWTGKSVPGSTNDLGYMLSGLEANGKYRIWFGTLSHWHGRTANVYFNGSQVAGQETMVIPSSKSFTIFENIAADANGKVDIHMTQIGDQNEPTICFIAVQKMSTELPVAPSAPDGAPVVGMEETSIALTGVELGSTLRIFNAEKPNQMLYEETAVEEHLSDGVYTLGWGDTPFDVAQFRVVQLNKGGCSGALLVSITDISDFKAFLEPEGYTTGKATVRVQAKATSGIASWSYRLGEYGEETVLTLDRPLLLDATFEAERNGDYFIVITSGLGVTYSESVSVNAIDADPPVIDFLPTMEGWSEGNFNVTLSVTSVAPVTEYKIFKDGKEIEKGETLPTAPVKFTDLGEYTVFVKTAAGQSSTESLRVSTKPITTVVRKSFARSQLRYSFGDSADYILYSVTAYQLRDAGISKMTIADGNRMDVYDAGTYIVTARTREGAVEMFALNVTAEDLKGENTGVVDFAAEGCGSVISASAAAFGAVVLAAGAFVTLLRKKKNS